jgi:FMN-dependent NADH-azoreductase
MAVFAGADPEGDQAAAWRAARSTFERFAEADQYVFSVPMWNAGIPYVLKQFIDVVSQPGMVSPSIPSWATPASSRAARRPWCTPASAVYGPGRPPSFGADFQAPYLRDWLNWAGIADVTEIAFRPNLATVDAEAGRQAAHAAARDAAKTF